MKWLYKITNNINNKSYIGVTIDPDRRWYQHYNGYTNCIALKGAMNKYGKDNFSFQVLVCGSRDYIDELEVSAIQLYNTTPPNGYNLTLGGDGSVLTLWEDKYTKLLGTMSDRDLSMLIGISESSVSRIRKSQEVERYCTHDYKRLDLLLGLSSDKKLAKDFDIPASTVTYRRELLGIKPYGKTPDKTPLPEECVLLIGTMSDKELADKFDANVYKINYLRKMKGIPKYTGGVGWRKIIFNQAQLDIIQDRSLTNIKVAQILGVGQATISRARINMKKEST